MAEPSQISYRTLKGIGLLDTTPVYELVPGFQRPEGNLRCSAYSPDGKFFAWASPEGVSVVDASVGHVVATIAATNVYELGFSPFGTFIITWQRPSKDENGDAVKNLNVWRTIDPEANNGEDRKPVGKFVQKNQTGWNLQYTADEKLCARVVTNEVQFYESGNLSTVWSHLRVEGVTDFAVAPGETQSVAVFIPERKGNPAAVRVFKVPNFDQAVSQKTFFKGDKVQLKWNEMGTSLIVLAQTDVDKSNRSYYGESTMYILSANGGFDSRIQLDKEGPIHDVTWSPSSKEFGVVYGYMPAKTVIFNEKAETVHSFALGPRNTIMFSPHGRFVLVAGFGNLAGQCDIYDLEKDYAKICTIEASNASICEWSPDGRHLLMATLSQRLKVDNGIRVYHVGGGLMYYEEMHELYDAKWRPQTTDKHPLGDPFNPVPEPHPSALAHLATRKTPSKPAGAYRPPGARGQSTPLAFKREDEGGSAFVSSGTSGASAVNGLFGPRSRGRKDVPGAETVDSSNTLPPGAVPGGGVSLTVENGDEGLSKAALKNKKKREAKKAKDAADKTNGEEGSHQNSNLLSPGDGSPTQRRDRSRSRNNRAYSPSPSRNKTPGGPGGDRPKSRGPGDKPSRPHSRGPKVDGESGATNNNVNKAKDKRGASRSPRPPPTRNGNLSPTKPANPTPLSTSMSTTTATTPSVDTLQTPATPGPGTPHEKKVRALHKKLRAIEELKMRQAGGEKLELSQISKIGSEESVRKDLASMEKDTISG